jgi:hypothetical protein
MNHLTPMLLSSLLCCFVAAQQPSTVQKKVPVQNQQIQKQTPPPAAAVPANQSAANITISRAVICMNVNEHEPEEPGDQFPPEVKRLYCFTEIKSSGEPLELQHRWYWKDELMSTIPLSVKSTRFRTFSAKSIPSYAVGDWRVAIVNSHNEETIQIIKFEIK